MNHRSSYSGTLTQRYDDYAMKHLAGMPVHTSRDLHLRIQTATRLILCRRALSSCRWLRAIQPRAQAAQKLVRSPRALPLQLIHSISNTNVGVAAAGIAGAYLLS